MAPKVQGVKSLRNEEVRRKRMTIELDHRTTKFISLSRAISAERWARDGPNTRESPR